MKIYKLRLYTSDSSKKNRPWLHNAKKSLLDEEEKYLDSHAQCIAKRIALYL